MTITRVSLILPDKIRLEDLTTNLRDKLINSGFEVVSDGYGHPSIKFNAKPTSLLENASFIAAYSYLAKCGVAFAKDATQMYSPAYTIKLLKEKGIYKEEITLYAYNDKKELIFETI